MQYIILYHRLPIKAVFLSENKHILYPPNVITKRILAKIKTLRVRIIQHEVFPI